MASAKHRSPAFPKKPGFFASRLRQFEPAATEVDVLAGLAPRLRFEHAFLQAVDDEPSLPFPVDEVGVTQDAQVMRHRHHFFFNRSGEIAHRFRSAAQHVDNAEPNRLAEGLELLGTKIGLEHIQRRRLFGHDTLGDGKKTGSQHSVAGDSSYGFKPRSPRGFARPSEVSRTLRVSG